MFLMSSADFKENFVFRFKRKKKAPMGESIVKGEMCYAVGDSAEAY